jgi:type II secretory pathway pseudopilin PulG
VLRRLAKSEGGFGLVERLIARVVMSIGITAIVAGYSSGILAVGRAKATTTAGALADRQMEIYRQGSFAAVPKAPGAAPLPPPPTGYSMQIDGSWSCPIPGAPTPLVGDPPDCSMTTPATRAVKLVTITVRDAATGKVLFTESATFDSSTG